MVLDGAQGGGGRSARRHQGFERLPLTGKPAVRPDGDWYPPERHPGRRPMVDIRGDRRPRSSRPCPTGTCMRSGRAAGGCGATTTRAERQDVRVGGRRRRPEPRRASRSSSSAPTAPSPALGSADRALGLRQAALRHPPPPAGQRTATASASPRRPPSATSTATGASRSSCRRSTTGSTCSASRAPTRSACPGRPVAATSCETAQARRPRQVALNLLRPASASRVRDGTIEGTRSGSDPLTSHPLTLSTIGVRNVSRMERRAHAPDVGRHMGGERQADESGGSRMFALPPVADFASRESAPAPAGASRARARIAARNTSMVSPRRTRSACRRSSG